MIWRVVPRPNGANRITSYFARMSEWWVMSWVLKEAYGTCIASSSIRHQPSVWVVSQVCISAMRGSGLPASGTSTLASPCGTAIGPSTRSEEHTSELQSLMRISYAVFCLKKKNKQEQTYAPHTHTQTDTHKSTHNNS